jgi:hypothetical protein
MPELGIGLSKRAQAMTGAFPVDVTGDDNPHPFSALRAAGHSESGLERLQEFNEIGFLSPDEIQLELPIVVIDHRP